jgi:hypothetical protein
VKTYAGKLTDTGHPIVTVDGKPLPPRLDLHNHAREFAWGFDGYGAAQLGLAILADVFGDDLALEHHRDFGRHVRVQLDGEAWTLPQAQVVAWMESRLGAALAGGGVNFPP